MADEHKCLMERHFGVVDPRERALARREHNFNHTRVNRFRAAAAAAAARERGGEELRRSTR
jgi:hypothetical protein